MLGSIAGTHLCLHALLKALHFRPCELCRQSCYKKMEKASYAVTRLTVMLAVFFIWTTVNGRIIVRSAHVEATMASHLQRFGQATHTPARHGATHHGKPHVTCTHSTPY